MIGLQDGARSSLGSGWSVSREAARGRREKMRIGSAGPVGATAGCREEIHLGWTGSVLLEAAGGWREEMPVGWVHARER